MKKNVFLYGAIIALSFLWTGSSFISIAYKLMESYTPLQIDIYLVVIGYLLQAFGMFLFSLGLRYRPDIYTTKRFNIAIMIAEALVISFAILTSSSSLTFSLSFLVNLLHGFVAGIYLTLLTRFVPQQYRGRCFGFGYAIGSIGSWIISLPYSGSFLKMDEIIIIYLILIASTIYLLMKSSFDYFTLEEPKTNFKFEIKFLIFVLSLLILLSMVKNIGFYFPVSDISNVINLELSRSFYAVGLIAAGFANDKNRRYGAICCVASLAFAFFSFSINNYPLYSVIMWIIGYIFFGFFAVYRVVLFSDLASTSSSLLIFAVYGLLAGRVGDSLGTLLGMLLSGNILVLLLVTTILFILLIFMFFSLYQKLYNSNLSENERKELKHDKFILDNSLTAREADVFRLVVQGLSNIEISSKLYISESTVKYHVGNILKKTGCSNRTDLTMTFKQS